MTRRAVKPSQDTARPWLCLLIAGVAAMSSGMGACRSGGSTTVTILLSAESEAARPDHALIRWTTPDGQSFRDERFPAAGAITAVSLELGRVMVELDESQPGERKVLVRGMRGERQVSSGAVRVAWLPGEQQELTIVLRQKPSDRDGDGVLDEIDDDCPGIDERPGPCRTTDAAARADGPPRADSGASPDVPTITRDTATDDRPDAGGSDVEPDTALPDAAGDGPAGDRFSGALGTGLVLYWPFDEMSGSTARDQSGNGHNGSFTGASAGTPPPSTNVPQLMFANAGSRKFDKNARHAVTLAGIPAALKGPAVSVSVWFRATVVDTTTSDLVSAGDNYALRIGADRLEIFRQRAGGKSVCRPSFAGHLDGSWHHLAATIDGSGMTLYFDGRIVSSCADKNTTVYDQGDDLWIGRHGNDLENADFDGNLDEVRLYSRVLTAAEVQDLAKGLP